MHKLPPRWRRSIMLLAAISLFCFFNSTEEAGAKRAFVRPARPANAPPPALPAGSVLYDFDGDGKADPARWHTSNYEVRAKPNGGGSDLVFTVGSSTSAIAAPGDFNGDGKTDACVFLGGTWTYKTSPSASAATISLGSSGDIPFVGKFDTDGIADAVVFTPSTRVWTIRYSKTATRQIRRQPR